MLRILSEQNDTDLTIKEFAVKALGLLLLAPSAQCYLSFSSRWHYDACSINQTLQRAQSPSTFKILIDFSVNRTFFGFTM